MSALFQPLQAGALTLPNRILMAPLTRCRAEAGHVPGDLIATHYAQRASAGSATSSDWSSPRHGIAARRPTTSCSRARRAWGRRPWP